MGNSEKNICGSCTKEQPQTDSRIQTGDETICCGCGRVVSIKWNYCPSCGNPVSKTPAL